MSLNLLLRLPFCVIPLIRAVYLALRDPDKRASARVAKLLLASKTPQIYWKKDAAVAVFFILTTLPNIVDANLAAQILNPTPEWFQALFYIGYGVIAAGSVIYWLYFIYRYPLKLEKEGT